jgi:ubiquinone/menaquinone biosynthesis C-methylase UbiE/energy-coupling factor transporter transmembrane protein EcfT
MKEKQEFFQQIAHNWDIEHNTPEEIERTRQFASEHFHLNKGETVLDIGCGTSRLVPSLEEMIGHEGKLVELDFSIEMLKIGKRRYEPDFRNILFLQADGHTLPLKDGSVDAVICMAFFPHLSDKAKAMGELARVLKPGGKLTIAHQMNRDELNHFHGNVNGPVKKDLLPDDRRMQKLLTGAGFQDIVIREEPGLYLVSATASGQERGRFWQRLDPRVKLGCLFSLAGAVAFTPVHFYGKFLVYLAMIILLGIISRVSLKYYFARFIILAPLLAFLAVTLLVFSEKEWPQKMLILYNLWVKTLLTFCCFGILALTVQFQHIIRSLESLKFPKVLTAILSFAYHYVFLFQREAARSMKARRSRSFGRPKKWDWKWQRRRLNSAMAIIPMFLFRVLERSQRIYMAMIARGYNENSSPYPLQGRFSLRMARRDYLFSVSFHLLLAATLII